ncbi:MAG: PilW family protein [Hyalangium sp.]|uniref:PilW family protein n=1 Tax=Hyalangium sp. TaxID=2028555 RepID=UPI00389AE49C
MPTSPRARGFTLLELLVGAAVGAVVLVGISLTFISQAQQYQSHASRRAIQANARQSLGFLERHLRVAGYGVDPDRAILAYDSYNAATDLQDVGYPDAFVVHWRDPLFARRVVAATPAVLTLDQPLKQPMRLGQILLVICSPNPSPTSFADLAINSTPPHAFITVGKYINAGTATINLDTTAPSSAPNSPTRGPGRLFHEQATLGGAGDCFHNATYPPMVVLVHRAAFYVAMFDNDGNPATPERTPYLMMHPGVDMPTATKLDGDGTIDANDAVPVAEGIEQLQAAYILDTNDASANKTPMVLGVDTVMDATHYGENWEQKDPLLPTGWAFNPFTTYPTRLFPMQVAPFLTLPQAHLRDHLANIRQVRVTLVARSTVPDPQIPGDNLLTRFDGSPYPTGPTLADGTKAWRQLENLTQGTIAAAFTPSGGHYYRTIVRQSVAPKNMLMNRQFVPVTPGGG